MRDDTKGHWYDNVEDTVALVRRMIPVVYAASHWGDCVQTDCGKDDAENLLLSAVLDFRGHRGNSSVTE